MFGDVMKKFFYDKVIYFLLIFGVTIVMFSLFGCKYKTKLEREKEEIFAVANTIVQSIVEKNEYEFTSYFTNEAVNSIDFKDGIDYTFNTFTGNVKSIEDRSSRVSDSFDNGMHTKIAKVRYNIVTDANEYVLSFEYYLKDEKYNNQYKISKLKLSLLNDVVNDSNPTFAWEYSVFGIYNPRWDESNNKSNY